MTLRPRIGDPAQTRCPWPGCDAIFAVESNQVGRAITCPGCHRPLTARPLAVWRKLDQQQQAFLAGEQKRIVDNSLRSSGSPVLRQRLFHRPSHEDPRFAERRFDLRYEAGHERPTPRFPPNPALMVLLDDLRSQWNVGSIFRTADCAGWGALRLCGITPMPPATGIERVALGASEYLAWDYHARVLCCVEAAQADGFELAALEQTDDALPLGDFEPPEKLCLVIGNEVGGVSAETLVVCEHRVAIPTHGRKASLNAAVAFGVAAFQIGARWRARWRRC